MFKGLCDVHALLVDDAVGIVDVFDEFVRKSAAAQTDEVDAGIGDGLTAGYDVGGDVFAESAAALYHDVASDAAELVHEHGSADDGVVVDDDLSGKLGGIADDTVVTDGGIVGHVDALHQQVVVAHYGAAFCGGAAVDGDVLADAVVVAYLGGGFLAPEFQILGHGSDDGAGEDFVVVADA